MILLGDAETEDSAWKGLYLIGGVGGLIAGALTLIDFLVFVVWSQPSLTDAQGWFTLFQQNWLIGLLDLDLLGIIAYLLLLPTILSLYFSLRRTSQSWMIIGTVLTFVGIVVYFASNTAFSLLALSTQYAAATTDTQRSMFLAAGQALLAVWSQIAFTESFILVSAALLVISGVMLRSNVFGRKTAYVGVFANLAGLGGYLQWVFLKIPLLFALNAVVLGIWFILIGRRLYQLGLSG
jgi:hypothetical protein